MYFARMYDQQLAQASYLVGCQATGEALVVDPTRDADQYIALAEREGLRITQVTETHIHADFVSGTRELASRTGARMLLSDAGPPDWRYAFRHEPGVTLLHHGDTFSVGRLTVQVLHTPGHTPEHLAFLLTDTAAGAEPMGLFTGDFVFVGDVGRPDLLEKAAHLATESATAARQLYRSLTALRDHPDHLQLWPGHGAGSACGKGLGAVPQSTLGYERRTNWAFQLDTESDFVAAVLAGQPEPPAYFGRMKIVNRAGPAVLGRHPAPERSAESLLKSLRGRATVVDTRTTAAFAARHIPGTINIPWNKNFTTYAGSLLPPDRDVYLLVAEPAAERAAEIAGALLKIGVERVPGYFGLDILDVWEVTEGALATVRQLAPVELKGIDRERYTIVDVRGQSEWDAGHIPGATHLPLPFLLERMAEIPSRKPIVVHCQGGGRSSVAASVLMMAGRYPVYNLTGGYAAWESA